MLAAVFFGVPAPAGSGVSALRQADVCARVWLVVPIEMGGNW